LYPRGISVQTDDNEEYWTSLGMYGKTNFKEEKLELASAL
jgi:hypothetical protein